MDKIKNNTFKETLKTEPIEQTIYQDQLRWFGHVSRMNKIEYSKECKKQGQLRRK